jgi:mono/diheme cytochrome c family protein
MTTTVVRVWAVGCLAAIVGLLAWAPVSAQGGKTTWDAVYSAEQAAKGEALYNAQCSKCHGDSAMGGDAPSLADSGFAASWDSLTLEQLYTRTQTSMPLDAPGTLTRQETTDIIAYLLRQNRFPAGSADLPSQSGQLGMVQYIATKPEAK